MKIREFANRYYRQHVLLTTSTGRARIGIYNNHIAPNFGSCDFENLSKLMIYDWKNSLLIRGYKPAMINKIQIIFGTLIDLASELEIAKANLRQELGFKLMRTVQFRENFLTKIDFKKLQKSCALSSNEFLLDIVLLLTLTGARKREVLDASWSNISFRDGRLIVPKSKNGSMRTVFLNKGALNILRSVQKRTQDMESKFVFPNRKTGEPYKCIFHSWNLARKRAGLDEVRLHDLRHSFASALVNEGIPIYDVQHLLGHKSVKTTQRYAHLEVDRLRNSSVASDKFYLA